MNVVSQFFRDDAGATMVEYAVMVAFIAAVCITLVATLGGGTAAEFSSFNSRFNGQGNGG
jgi:Flp pilus assembly pilin Flp